MLKTLNYDTMNTIRSLLFANLLLAVQSQAAAQKTFTTADGEAVQAYLRESYTKGNAGMVIGLLDGTGARVFGAGKLDNGTDATPGRAGFRAAVQRG